MAPLTVSSVDSPQILTSVGIRVHSRPQEICGYFSVPHAFWRILPKVLGLSRFTALVAFVNNYR
jgi:hypothetical protein